MTQQFVHQGIVLLATPYQNNQQIVQLYTKEQGMISAIRRSKWHIHPPLEAEFTLQKTKGDLFRIQEISHANYRPFLSKTMDQLSAAHKILLAIRTTQPVGKLSPTLYAVLSKMLSALRTFSATKTLLASFWLKLLKHEGMIFLSPYCSVCGTALERAHFCDGALYCPEHREPWGEEIEKEELEELLYLCYQTDLSLLSSYSVSDQSFSISEKIFQNVCLCKTNQV